MGKQSKSRATPPQRARRTSEPSPFDFRTDRNNACINNGLQFEELARYYRESADALVKCAREDRSTLDVHIYAICFLYRHSLELLLKVLFWQSGYILDGDKSLWMNHGLCTLWGQVNERTRRLLDSDFPLTTEEAAVVNQLFEDIEEHDPKSDAFRYTIDTKKQTTHPKLTHVSVPALSKSVHEVTDHLARIHQLVDYWYTQRSEAERESV